MIGQPVSAVAVAAEFEQVIEHIPAKVQSIFVPSTI